MTKNSITGLTRFVGRGNLTKISLISPALIRKLSKIMGRSTKLLSFQHLYLN